jgi:hypothetical protein
MGILASIFTGPIISAIAGSLFDKLAGAWESYMKKEINKEQMHAKIQEALTASFAEVEKALLDSMAKTYASFMQTMAQSPVMQRAWSIVLYSQLFVLFWHQMVIPALATMGIKYASSGATVDWSYALIALCLGAPQIVSRIGPAASWATDSLKRLGGK